MGDLLPLRHRTWRGNAELHTLIETIATLMALITGAMALVRYYTKKGSTFSSLAALTPWSGVNSRVFLSLLMYASVLTWEGERQRLNPDRRSELVVYLVVGIWTALSFFCFAVIPLPTDYYPKLLIPRPTEIGPILFFGLATAGYLRKGPWKFDEFDHWLVLSLVVTTSGQLIYAAFYRSSIYDPRFFAGHLMKVLGLQPHWSVH